MKNVRSAYICKICMHLRYPAYKGIFFWVPRDKLIAFGNRFFKMTEFKIILQNTMQLETVQIPIFCFRCFLLPVFILYYIFMIYNQLTFCRATKADYKIDSVWRKTYGWRTVILSKWPPFKCSNERTPTIFPICMSVFYHKNVQVKALL